MQRLFTAFRDAGRELYLVGGAVRDLALGVPLEALDDLDFCTNARPDESLAILKQSGFVTYDVGIEFGTVGCVLYHDTEPGYPKDCQVTTYRSAEYYRRGSRHPQVKYGDTIAQDLRRRDFSINSIGMDENGEFVDPYDGLGDLKRRILRVVSDPHETLAEDPLRILRIGRFVSRLGFEVDETLREAANARAEHILDISRERWLQEMNKLLVGPNVAGALAFLNDVRILGVILPEVAQLYTQNITLWEQTLVMVSQASQAYAQRWAALLLRTGDVWAPERPGMHASMLCEGISRRLTFDNQMAQEVRFLLANHDILLQPVEPWTEGRTRRFVRDMDPYVSSVIEFAELVDVTLFSHARRESFEALRTQIAALEAAGRLRPQLPAGIGRDIIQACGLKPGPEVGLRKDFLEDCLLEGTLSEGRDISYYVDYLKTHFRPVSEKNP